VPCVQQPQSALAMGEPASAQRAGSLPRARRRGSAIQMLINTSFPPWVTELHIHVLIYFSTDIFIPSDKQ